LGGGSSVGGEIDGLIGDVGIWHREKKGYEWEKTAIGPAGSDKKGIKARVYQRTAIGN